MQIKKEDLRQSIYQCAAQEFLSKGFENASMRTIAKKANTSIGNIYHYYPSKDALLDEMMEGALRDVTRLFDEHLKMRIRVHSIDEIDEVLEQADNDAFGLACLIRPEVVIFIKQNTERYRERKESFLKAFREHLAWHLNCRDADEYFVKMVTNMFMESIVFIVKTNQSKENAMQDFLRMFRMICGGLITKD